MMNLIYPYYQTWFIYIASWPTAPYYQPYLGFTSIPSRLIYCLLLIPDSPLASYIHVNFYKYHVRATEFGLILKDATWHYIPGLKTPNHDLYDVTKVTLAPEICGSKFKSVISENYISSSCQIAHMNTREHLWRYINIGSSNSLVPSRNKPLLDPIWPISLSSYGTTLRLRKKTFRRQAFQMKFIQWESCNFTEVWSNRRFGAEHATSNYMK